MQLLTLVNIILLQIPKGVPQPKDNEPLLLNSPFDYILYIGLPILILIGFFLWRRREKKRSNKD